MTELLLLLAPALALLCALVLGRYPGEPAIARLRARRASGRVRRGRAVPVPRPGRVALLPRGGGLVAAAVAARPPPGG